ncbi:MAG: DUF4442 domain-containing protein [Chitinophagaceae bacterium]
MSEHTSSFIRLMSSPVKFRLFLLAKLPSAFFAGVRVRQMNEQRCEVTVPFKWFSQNPFRSTYFACLSMAGEMSTGVLGMAHVYKIQPAVSMLVLKVESEYFKKATGRTTFVCEDGGLFKKMIDEAIATGEARTVRARSVGHNKEGEVVSEMYVTWSFKTKSKK